MDWTPERIRGLRELAVEGSTRAQAARNFGVTRSSIISASRRYGVKFGTQNQGQAASRAPRKVHAPQPKPPYRAKNDFIVRQPNPPERTPCAPTLPYSQRIMYGEKAQCAFIFGEGRADAPCCGQPITREGASYCSVHLRVVQQPLRGRTM